MNREERKRIFLSLLVSLAFVYLLWLIHFLAIYFNIRVAEYGLIPKNFIGLRGILLAPLLHADQLHLISNSISLFILSCIAVYYYQTVFYQATTIIYLLSGVLVWLFARPSSHIGASGLVYGIATFIFFSGIFRRDTQLITISLLVIFLYGSLFWGLFPFIPHQSFEYHLAGALSGVLASYIFRNKGPQRKQYSWEQEGYVQEDFENELEEEIIETDLSNENNPENKN